MGSGGMLLGKLSGFKHSETHCVGTGELSDF